jgi:small subunit ribosomal protein S1
MIPGEKPSLAGLTKEQVDKEVEDALEGTPPGQVGQLLEESMGLPRSGQVVEGRVLGVQGEEIVVDVGLKSEGYVQAHEFDDVSKIRTGDSIEVYVDGLDEETGAVVLSKRKADRIKSWERVIENHVVGDTVTGRVMRKIKGGLLVDIGVPAFLPASQIDMRRVGDVGEYIGQTLTSKIIKIDEDRRNIVLSRRKLLEEERERQKKKLLGEIQRGEIRKGIVRNLTEFGAFIDLGGIDGLLHITDMSWGRISHPSEVLKPDEVVEVKVLDYDLDRERISLGFKQLQPNPWQRVREKYPVGSKVLGEVMTLQPYGAFVKIEDGVEGLVHVSEMSWGRPVSHPSEIVKLGDRVEVVVLSIDEDRREMSLGLKQASGDPWADVEKKLPVGSRVKGAVRNLTGYGAFVELAEGVDGLLHVSDISWTKKINHPSAVLKKGDEVEALVLSVDSERKRVALGLKQLDEDPWAHNIPGRYRPGDKVKGKVTKLANFGAFIEIEADLEGLLHVSEISDDKVEKPEDVLKVDQEVELTVINVDAKDRKIGLSMKEHPDIQAAVEAEPPPAGAAEAILEDANEPRQRTLGDLLARHTERGAEPEAAAELDGAPSDSGEAGEATGE